MKFSKFLLSRTLKLFKKKKKKKNKKKNNREINMWPVKKDEVVLQLENSKHFKGFTRPVINFYSGIEKIDKQRQIDLTYLEDKCGEHCTGATVTFVKRRFESHGGGYLIAIQINGRDVCVVFEDSELYQYVINQEIESVHVRIVHENIFPDPVGFRRRPQVFIKIKN